MLLKEESTIILSMLNKCTDIAIVSEIIECIEPSTASIHKSVYEEALEFYKRNARFPELAYFKKEFPEMAFGAEYTGDYSLDIIVKFLTDIRIEVGQVEAQSSLMAGEFDKTAEICRGMASLGKEVVQYTTDDTVAEYDKYRGKTFNVLSGIKQIDDIINGFSYGHLTVIAAPPACYKTTLAQNIAYYAMSNNFKVAFLSFELMKRNIMNNMISRHSACIGQHISSEHMNKQLLDKHNEYDRYIEVAEDFKKQGIEDNLFVVSPDDLTIWEPSYITKLLEQIDEKMGGLDIVILDYIQICRSFATFSGVKDTTNFVNGIIGHLSFLSKTYKGKGLITFVLSQVNREGMKEMGKNKNSGSRGMNLSSLAEFNALEREASVVLFLYANDADKASRKVQAKVAKNRYGNINEEPVLLPVDPTTGVIGDYNFSEVLNLEGAIEVSQELGSYQGDSDDSSGLFG